MSISSRELNHKVLFREPSSSLNNMRETEITHVDGFTTFAKVDNTSESMRTEGNGTGMVTILDIFIRWAQSRDSITHDWEVVYNGSTYKINEIERIDQKQRFLRIRVTTKNSG